MDMKGAIPMIDPDAVVASDEGQLIISPIFLSSHRYNLPPSKPSS
tara:strand:- start:182 stop:316 length:135 start_codon:yes stop_codon:yes gene_type:complete